MTQPKINLKPRIQIVDAIRGFALFGILMLHSIEHFDLLSYPESSPGILANLDPIISNILFFIFGGKAYSIFSIMFGFSFYIQMQNQAERGVDFRGKFAWRLVVLFAIGYLHSLMYIGDVLTVFAMLGLPLVLLYKLENKWLILISVLLMIQVPVLYNIALSVIEPDYTFHQDWTIWGDVKNTFANGSFPEVFRFNSASGHQAKWLFMYNTGRYLQMISLFIIGILIGRTKYFENIAQHKRLTFRLLTGSVVGFLLFYTAPYLALHFNLTDTQNGLINALTTSYSNFFFTILLITAFILIYLKIQPQMKYSLLASYGKMSLTSYVMQPLFGVLFFYGYGLGMHRHFGVTLSLFYGIVFLILQLFFCKIWLKHFYYGPLEWFWRALTFFDFKTRFRKSKRTNSMNNTIELKAQLS